MSHRGLDGLPADGERARLRPPAEAELDPAERMSRDELEALQSERLRATVAHAYANVPLYRRKLDDLGVAPEDLRGRADAARLPFTTKADLRSTYPFGMFAVPRERVARIHASSGTTGRPTVVGYTAGDLHTWAGLMARSLRASGIRPGMLVHNAYGYGLFTGGLGAHAGIEALGATAVPVSGGQTARQVRLIRDFAPHAVLCTPSYLLTIADAMEEEGVAAGGTGVRVAVLGAEPWTEEMRRELEARLGLDALDIYGLSEVMGPGVATECLESKDGPHLWEDHFLPEVVSPTTGEPLPDGTLGELVLTSLTKEALPVIRYRTGDLTRLLPGTARPAMRRIEKISGRTDDMIILRGVNLFPTQIEELVLGTPDLAPHFVLELVRHGNRDHLGVRIERPASVPHPRSLAAARVLAGRIKEHVGVTVDVLLEEPGALPRSEGKLQRVRDLRGSAKQA